MLTHNEELGFAIDTLYASGSFEQWSGFGVITDLDGDGIYVGTTEIVEGSESNISTLLEWGNFESGAELGSEVIGTLMMNRIIMVRLLLQT